MGERIAMGFHTCVDYELVWDTQVVEERIRALGIQERELRMDIEMDSERAVWIACLAHLKEGIGGEMVPDTAEICERFAGHFGYSVTLGGTPTRAAIILDRLGYDTALQTSCYNEHVERLMPARVHVLPGVDAGHDEIYPHIVLQCRGGVRIHANDIDFVTPRENRLMVSRDIDSLQMPILPDAFGEMIVDAEVFLLGCFSEVIDLDVLKGCLEKTKALLAYLPKDACVVLEDGCYVKKEFRYYVHKELASAVHVLSMNEDELQQYIGKRIDIFDAAAVKAAVEYVYGHSGVKTILVHSAAWVLSYGEMAQSMHSALKGGMQAASTRFRLGDGLTREDYEETGNIPDKAESADFCDKICRMWDGRVCCIPCKDLSFVETPTVVGLGDSFVGGLLPGLLKENRK
ncbi:MAG: hypothetical protein HFH55_11350 [Lachnospiraceae bacterium]|nr:hypothetical protein [Lachnospiraceae bacterium]